MARYSIAIVGTMAGQQVINVHGLDWDNVAAPETQAEAAAAAEAAFVAWKAAFLVRLSDQYTVLGAQARGVGNPLILGESTGPPQAGARLETPLPSFAVAKVLIRSTEPGRAGRGRTGLSGVTENYTDLTSPNRLNGGGQLDLQQRADVWFASLKGGVPPRQLTVVSRFKGVDPTGKPVRRPVPIASNATSVTVAAELGTRVSRLR